MRVVPLLFLVACGTSDPFEVEDPTDADEDGLADELESKLVQHFAPLLRLPPDDQDWTRPANVDWFLPQVKMRFDHPNCPDDSTNLIDRGDATFAKLADQRHHTKNSLCQHNDGASDERFSNQKALEFFLQAEDDDATHPGIPPERYEEWRSYVHVRPSGYPGAAYDLQVWFFFAYNDAVSSANHEADWEHMTISLSDVPEVVSVFYATHDDGFRVDDLATLAFEGTHVVGYTADGTHATYATPGSHDAPSVDDQTYDGGPVWETWSNFANLGEIGKVLDGQDWARYGGRWGEVGNTSFTTGPPGPMFNGKWETTTEY